MKYFKLNPNITSKKWEGFINLGELLISGNEIDEFTLSKHGMFRKLPRIDIEILAQGKISPINTVGSSFFVIDAAISGVESLETQGVQLIPLKSTNTQSAYLLIHTYTEIDYVNWESSEYEAWPKDHELKIWQNAKGRFFFKPVLLAEKTPNSLNAFRLQGWGGAFNIVISEHLKNLIQNLNFDHSFLEFHEIPVN